MVVVESIGLSNRTVIAFGELYRFEPYAIKSQGERYTVPDITPGQSIVIEIEEGLFALKRIVRWIMVGQR